MSAEPVEARLFDLLDDYAESIRDGSTDAARSVARSSKVITFIQSFYEQLFASCFDLELVAFDDASKRLVIEMRHDEEVPKELVPIVSSFEELCDLYPDIIGASYGGGSTLIFKRFHKRFLRKLLRSIATWAQQAEHPRLADRAAESGRRLQGVLKAAKW